MRFEEHHEPQAEFRPTRRRIFTPEFVNQLQCNFKGKHGIGKHVEKALLMDMIAVDTATTAPICNQQQSRIRTSALHIHGMQGERAGGGSPSPPPLQLTVRSIPLRVLTCR